MKTLTVVAASLGALALGGSALATASSSSSAPEKVSASDPGPAVQQGDQTTPDGAFVAKKHAKAHVRKAQADPPGANDTTSADTGSTVPENAPENASENAPETGSSDGPGGFADSSPNADSQQQGEH